MKFVTDDVQKKVYFEVIGVFQKYSANVTPLEMVALLSNILGKVITFQDKSQITPEELNELILSNIKIGAEEAMSLIHNTQGNA